MEGGDVMPVWSLFRGYFSPATLFLLLNVVIGTIVLTSRSHRRHHHHGNDDEHRHRQPPAPQQEDYSDRYAPPAPLARTSSVMERLRSLGLYRFRSGDFPPEYNHSLSADIATDDENSRQQQAHCTRSRSEPSARPPVDKTGNKEEKAAKAKVAKKSSSEVKRLERAPAPPQARVVQRVPRAPRAGAGGAARSAQAAVAREEKAANAKVAKKSSSEAAVGTSGCVDARADDFINKFRQQLQLQRLNSLLNYNEMLNRGT